MLHNTPSNLQELHEYIYSYFSSLLREKSLPELLFLQVQLSCEDTATGNPIHRTLKVYIFILNDKIVTFTTTREKSSATTTTGRRKQQRLPPKPCKKDHHIDNQDNSDHDNGQT